MVRREATVQAGAASLEVDVTTQLKCLTDSTRCAEKVLEWMAGCVHERQCLDEIYSVFFGKKWPHRLIRREPDLLKSWSRCHYGPKTWQEWSKDLSDLSACIKVPLSYVTSPKKNSLVNNECSDCFQDQLNRSQRPTCEPTCPHVGQRKKIGLGKWRWPVSMSCIILSLH